MNWLNLLGCGIGCCLAIAAVGVMVDMPMGLRAMLTLGLLLIIQNVVAALKEKE